MDPELVRIFCEEYAAELNRLRANAGAARAAKEAELGKVIRDHAKLVDAILAGVPAAQVKDRMIALDAHRQQIEAELAAAPEAQPVRLHPTMAETYRVRVRELVEGLSHTDHTQALEAREAVRALVDRIILAPSAEEPGELTVDLEGVLAQLFRLGLDQRSRDSDRGVRHGANKKAAPFGTADLQLELVAGAGFEPAAFRL